MNLIVQVARRRLRPWTALHISGSSKHATIEHRGTLEVMRRRGVVMIGSSVNRKKVRPATASAPNSRVLADTTFMNNYHFISPQSSMPLHRRYITRENTEQGHMKERYATGGHQQECDKNPRHPRHGCFLHFNSLQLLWIHFRVISRT